MSGARTFAALAAAQAGRPFRSRLHRRCAEELYPSEVKDPTGKGPSGGIYSPYSANGHLPPLDRRGEKTTLDDAAGEPVPVAIEVGDQPRRDRKSGRERPPGGDGAAATAARIQLDVREALTNLPGHARAPPRGLSP